MFVWILIRR